MATTTTPNLSLTLAVPGSNEPFSTSVVNTNFTAIDTFAGAQNSTETAQAARLTTIEKITLPSVAPADYIGGVAPAGTASERDAYWGTPANATDRVALANKVARWLNVDKGWEEQYYADATDAGAGRFSRKQAGWYPSAHLGRIPLRAATYTVTGGTNSQDGGRVFFDGAVTRVVLDNVFTADFNEYEVICTVQGTLSADLAFALRTTAPADIGGMTWMRSGWDTTPTPGISGFGASVGASLVAGRISPSGSWQKLDLFGMMNSAYPVHPTIAPRPTVFSRSHDNDGYSRSVGALGGGIAGGTNIGGFALAPSTGTMSGFVEVYGINRY